MKAAVLTRYREFEIKEMPVRELKSGELLVKIEYASICGSDMHIFTGDFHPRTHLPFIPGHEMAGLIEKTGDGVEKFAAGDKVAIDPIIWCGKCPACITGHYPACSSLKLIGIDEDGGFCQYLSVKESMLYKVPKHLSSKYAALAEIYAIGFHANKRAGVKSGDSLAIWGAGRVGQVILQAARTKTDGKIFMIDILDSRLDIASKSNNNIIAINSERENPVETIKEYTDGKGVDIAFEAVGHARPVKDVVHPVRGCIQSIKGGGTVCVLGLSDEAAPVIFKELIWKEAKILTSRVSHGEFAEAIDHMAHGNLNPEALISEIMPVEQIQKAFELLESNPEKYLKILLEL
jgi:(R,R)-butanediol dehydrogenase/meso-butanediol dehydrogenase/diacetyl reductase